VDADDFVDDLARVINHSDKSQNRIAKQAGVGKGFLSKIVRGKRTPSLEATFNILDVLDYEVQIVESN